VRAGLQVWTIGHSNHSSDDFFALVVDAEIDVIADVRSQPYSRYSPQFNQHSLKGTLAAAGIRYVFVGHELGGRPPEPAMYDDEGHVLYGEVAKSERFRSGLDRVVQGAASWRIALMCSEENPKDCHRRLLLTRVLQGKGIDVVHIRGDGTASAEPDFAAQLGGPEQQALFSTGSEAAWRSVRSVLPSTQQRSSSKPSGRPASNG
jgi:uncharacterized protein (DUF488 family)